MGTNFYRAIAQVYPSGAIQITNTNAYSGNNAAEAKFATLQSAAFGEVLRGVSFTPGTSTRHHKK